MYPNGLSGAVEVSFGCRVGNMRPLEGGEESEIFLVDTEVGERVLRLGPGWRSSALSLRSLWPPVVKPMTIPQQQFCALVDIVKGATKPRGRYLFCHDRLSFARQTSSPQPTLLLRDLSRGNPEHARCLRLP
jgi:hypothetical protein